MSNSYFNHVVNRVPPGSLARADQINNIADEIAAGFDLVPDVTGVADGSFNFAVAGGTANALTVAMPTTQETLNDGLTIRFRATAENTGAVTLDVDSIGPIAVVTPAGATLTAGALKLGAVYEVTYSSALAKFVLTSQSNVVEQALTGLTGTIVGTTDAQTLTNKTIDAGSNTIGVSAVGLSATELEGALAELQSNIDNIDVSTDIAAHAALTNTHGVSGAIVGTNNAQTLTNKTIPASTNIIGVSAAGISATTLQAALAELQASIDALTAGTIGSIGDIADVVLTSVTDNEVLAYNSGTGKWINQTANEAGLATSNHTHASSAITDFTSAAAAVVTYENLNSNGDVGTGSSQVARGNHNHDGVYAVEGHTHAQYVLGDGTDHPAAVIIDVAAFDFILRDQSLGTTNFFWRDGGALKLGGADTIVQFRGDVQFGDSAGNISALFDADGNFHIGAAAVAVDYGYALNVVGSNSSTALVRNAGSSSTAGLRLSGSRTGNGNAPSQIELGNREGGSTDTALAILEAIRQGTNSLDLAFSNGGSGLSPTETLRIPASGAAMYGPAVGVRQVGYADSAINAAYTVEGDLITVTLTGVQVGSKVTLIGMAKLDFNANTDAYLNITNASNVALASEIMRNGSTATYGEFQTISVTAQATSPGTGTVTFKLRGYGTSVDFLWYSLMAIEHK